MTNLLKNLSPKLAPALVIGVVALILYAITRDPVVGGVALAALGSGGLGIVKAPTRTGGRSVTQADLEAHAHQLALRRRPNPRRSHHGVHSVGLLALLPLAHVGGVGVLVVVIIVVVLALVLLGR